MIWSVGFALNNDQVGLLANGQGTRDPIDAQFRRVQVAALMACRGVIPAPPTTQPLLPWRWYCREDLKARGLFHRDPHAFSDGPRDSVSVVLGGFLAFPW